ncbi:MAG: hypothetical protein C0404_04710 [Verrucomicrobia bacterium]|nr:hypothetical protein [Verrucomicrobiota bacterium]
MKRLFTTSALSAFVVGLMCVACGSWASETVAVIGALFGSGVDAAGKAKGTDMSMQSKAPVWTTSIRLLKLGESLEFNFRLPPGVSSGGLKIYPQYLEQANPGTAFKPGGDLKWLESLPSEPQSLTFSGAEATLTYIPKRTGNYIAEWRVGAETYYRYFSVIDDAYIVLSFATFFGLDPAPTFHGTGIPLDYRYPIAKFSTNDTVCRRLLDYNRVFGDLVVPAFMDLPGGTHEERVRVYGEGMAKARALLPDPLDHRSIRVDMQHKADPGYPLAFAEIGVNDHCGLWEANCAPWIGMPEFLYYASSGDCRKVNQSIGGQVVSHQWDFCGSFHFLGPVDWHYAASEGHFEKTEQCMKDGMDEFKGMIEMNDRPVFVTPLYGGVEKSWGDNPNPAFQTGDDRRGMGPFIERYQRHIAFELTKKYKLAFTRSIDMVDYYRRHCPVTPRTVYVSKTKHQLYDAWWTQGSLNNYGVVHASERIPWSTSISTVRKLRTTPVFPDKSVFLPLKDPLSCEYVLIEDQKRQIRFERECPNPIWWFDYNGDQKNEKGSLISAVETPDVMILRSQSFSKEAGLTIKLTMKTQASFPGYAILLWGLPLDYNTPPENIVTTAQSYTLAKNGDGETHMVLYFDLKPGAQLQVTLRKPKAERWEWQ